MTADLRSCFRSLPLSVDLLQNGDYETGNFLEIARLDGLFFEGFPVSDHIVVVVIATSSSSTT